MNGDPVGFIDPLGLAGLGTNDCPKRNKRKGKSSNSKFEFDYDKEREIGIKRITDEFGGVIEGVANRSKTLNPKEIRFMQSTITNKTGQYTVLDNAKTFSENPSKIFELNPIRAWQDGKGNIWTLDHRRLGASRLADLDKIPVHWASKAEVYQDAWKLSKKVDGKSIVLKIGKGLKEIIQ
ncbi:hypothetical protein EEL30_12100 [Brevibacillus laterosporus]|uniref:Uncharacterized protein n=1 Tax=Brevibacillus laterosporus TaxID=1465 RepID=A0A518V7J7_BRELA|nr:hypothetical protein EEL30_12100 [Brevibacillus laterosporus]